MKVPPVPEPFIPPSPDFQALVLRELTAIKWTLDSIPEPAPDPPPTPRLHRLTRLIPILGAKL